MGNQGETAVYTTMRIEVRPRTRRNDSRRLQAAHQLGLTAVRGCYVSRLYFLQGTLAAAAVTRVAAELLADPVTEVPVVTASINAAESAAQPEDRFAVEVTLLPGVTDPPADNLVRAARRLGIAGIDRAATGQRYECDGRLTADERERLATQVLANPDIQQVSLDAPISPPFVPAQVPDGTVELIELRGADSRTLRQISRERRLSLNEQEMQAIQAYYAAAGRAATDVELEMLAQTWSEHCGHKTFRAHIEYTGPQGKETIDGLLKSYIRATTEALDKPWVHSAFVDNAGIVAFDDDYDLAFKAEAHNHPSALAPFDGANTGIGGVVRDVLGVSARPIANTDILCFGLPETLPETLPEGVLHPRRVADGVVHGIEDYGNKTGIPTVNGGFHYHPGYTANPLVCCGCLGILPRGTQGTEPRAGDLVVAIGGRSGRDGLRSITRANKEMDVETSEVAGTTVQIGYPILEKQTQEVILQARNEGLYNAITGCGTGGFSAAVGEMAQTLGATIQLQNIALKYPGLRPWEMWLSEAQERMVLAVAPERRERLQAICDGHDVELIVLGHFSGDGRMTIRYGDDVVAALSMQFWRDGLPRRQLKARWQPSPVRQGRAERQSYTKDDCGATLLRLLAHPTIRSKEGVIRRYDHEVQGGTAVKPLVGRGQHGPSDAAVIVPQETQLKTQAEDGPSKGAALGNGINPHFTALDPYNMAWAAVDEAMRNVVAVGANPEQVSIVGNFCWGNPNLPDRLGALVRCVQGCTDAAIAYGTPFISGKDSLNNEYSDAEGRQHAIPGTLLISALGIVPDVRRTVTMDLKSAGNFLFVVGDTRAELGGSHFNLIGGRAEGSRSAPAPVKEGPERMRRLHKAISQGLVQACHDCAEGGLAVALAEMCLAGGQGIEAQLMRIPRDWHANYSEAQVIFFAESLSRFLVEVRPEDEHAFRATLGDQPHECIGVVGGDTLVVNGRFGEALLAVPVGELEKAWRGATTSVATKRAVPHVSAPVAAANPKEALTLKSQPRVLVLHANGTNRDHDAALACELAGGAPEIVHLNQLASGVRRLADYHMLIIPGGFTYGDDLGAGVLWALDLRVRFGAELQQFVAEGRPVLGIGNGFQTLVKSGLLPGWAAANGRDVTLTFNRSDRFECRWVYLQPDSASPSLFTGGMDAPIFCPVAHGAGRLALRDDAVAQALQAQHLLPLRYSEPAAGPVNYPANPNGSILDIAALCNPAGNVMGLMPHPENHIFPWQQPQPRADLSVMSGLRLFENGIKHA